MSPRENPGRRNVRPPGLCADVAEFSRVAIRDRWGLGLMAIAWVHLGTFLVCHAMYVGGDLRPMPYLGIWAVEMTVIVVLLRRMVTSNGRHTAPPLVGLLARVWVTFMILAFSVLSINNLSGMPPDWFKPVWCTLSTFGFAMTAWLVSRWFLVPAVQMSLTGMMMVRFPEHAYFIYGISWWIALHTVALALEKVRRKSIDRSKEESAKLYDLKRRSEVAEVAPLMSSRS